jgi:excisionase family DNA binding protein
VKIALELTDEQFSALADAVAQRMEGKSVNRDALSVPEVAARTGLSQPTIRRRIKSGAIPTVPGLNPARIPANFINRMMKNEP